MLDEFAPIFQIFGFHLMTDKIHLMTEPTADDPTFQQKVQDTEIRRLLNERSFSIITSVKLELLSKEARSTPSHK
jgi:hypothetical protein